MKLLIISIFILLSFGQLTAQAIRIPQGNIIQNDGIFSNGEWSDADTISLQINSTQDCKVVYKHDGTNLLLAFLGNLQSSMNYFPEVNIDVNHDRASSFQADDWWFHVSASDCEYQGAYGNYNNCQVVRPNWKANPNFNISGPAVDSVEISIPFQTLLAMPGDTIGMSFLLNNFQNYRYFPSHASYLNPSSWATFIISSVNTGIASSLKSDERIDLWPNPAQNKLNLMIPSEFQNGKLAIKDIKGALIRLFEIRTNQSRVQLEIDELEPGIYFLECTSSRGTFYRKFIRQ